MKAWGAQWIVLLALLAVDQAIKVWVRAAIPLSEITGLIPGLIDLTHVENPGISFSFLGALAAHVRVPLLVGVTLATIVALAGYWMRKRAEMDRWMNAGMAMILAGAVGNLIDRFAYGTVTDYLHFRIGAYSLFVNNAADIFISLGVVACVASLYWPERAKR